MQPGHHQSGDVGHVHDQARPHLLRDRREPREVDDPRVGARARHDDPRPVLPRERFQLLVVDAPVLGAHAVLDRLPQLPGVGDRMPVREVAAVRQAHAQERVARLRDRQVGRHVRRRARVRLHVRVLGGEQLLHPVTRQLLRHIHELAATVVALARQALGVLVGHDRAHRLEHRVAHEVLGGDQLEGRELASPLVPDRVEDGGVLLAE